MWSANSAWEIMASISATVIALGVVLALLELWVTKRTAKRQALNRLLEMWGNAELREARHFVLNEFKFRGLAELYADGGKKDLMRVEEVCDMCDRVSYAVMSKLVSEKDVFKLIGLPMVCLWGKLKPFIDDRRREDEKNIDTDSPYKYALYFDKLANKYIDRIGYFDTLNFQD